MEIIKCSKCDKEATFRRDEADLCIDHWKVINDQRRREMLRSAITLANILAMDDGEK